MGVWVLFIGAVHTAPEPPKRFPPELWTMSTLIGTFHRMGVNAT